MNGYDDVWYCIKCGRVYHNLESNNFGSDCFCGSKVQEIRLTSVQDLKDLNINWN